MRISKSITTVAASLMLAAAVTVSTPLYAGVISVDSVTVTAGGSVDVGWNFQNNTSNDIGTIEFCIQPVDFGDVDSFDLANCVANVPAPWSNDFGTGCSATAPSCPDGFLITVSDIVPPGTGTPCSGGPLPDLNPGGSIEITTDAGLAENDEIELQVSIIEVVEHDPCFNVDNSLVQTLEDGLITIVDIAPALSVNPASLNFTAQSGTTSASQDVEACNSGNADGLEITTSFSGVNAANFGITSNNCPSAAPGLAEGACCTVGVNFEPDAIDTFSASLDFATNANNESVTLSGEGTAGPAGDITITPASHDFEELLTNSESAQFTFTVSNNASPGSAVDIDTVSLAGSGDFTIAAENCDGTSLAAGSSCSVTVQYAPTSDGPASTTLTVSGEDGNGDTQSDTATAEGEGFSEARFSSNPAPGNINLGVAGAAGSLDIDVVVSNSGNINLTVDCTVVSNDGDVFTFDPLSFSVAPNGSESFNAACDLPDMDTYSATLSCDTNDADNATVSYTFTCTGREPLPVPAMQPWGLVLLTLMMLLAAGFSMRYFRAG